MGIYIETGTVDSRVGEGSTVSLTSDSVTFLSRKNIKNAYEAGVDY